MSTVDEATSEDVFDVLAFISETAYPTETVTVFRDVKSATEYTKLSAKRLDNDAKKKDRDATLDAELTKQMEELGEKIKTSAMIFELRGMPPGIVQAIVAAPDPENDTPEAALLRDNDLIAKSIVSVMNVKGVKDNRVWDKEAVGKLRYFLKEGEFGKLVSGVSSVNFNAMVFDDATDAGFSGGSSDVA